MMTRHSRNGGIMKSGLSLSALLVALSACAEPGGGSQAASPPNDPIATAQRPVAVAPRPGPLVQTGEVTTMTIAQEWSVAGGALTLADVGGGHEAIRLVCAGDPATLRIRIADMSLAAAGLPFRAAAGGSALSLTIDRTFAGPGIEAYGAPTDTFLTALAGRQKIEIVYGPERRLFPAAGPDEVKRFSAACR